jgi:hypothetical protein
MYNIDYVILMHNTDPDNFTRTAQEHVVIINREKDDNRWYFDEVAPWIEENIGGVWSVSVTLNGSGLSNIRPKYEATYEFSFADIQDAVLFKLRF